MLGTARDVPQTFAVGEYRRRKDALGVSGFLEASAEMQLGSSGGPLFDPKGRVVGLGAARTDWENPSGLFIPVERVRALADSLPATAEPRPFGTPATFLDASEWAVQASPEMEAATAAAAKGDDAGLVDVMRAVVAKHPRSALALHRLARAQSRAGDDVPALDSLRQALALLPCYLEAASDLADALERLGRHREAATAFRRAIEMEARDLGLWFGLGRVLVGAEEFASAAKALERVTEGAPDRPDVWAWLGVAYARAGRLDDARAVVRRLRPVSPDMADRLEAEIATRSKGGGG
jgi:Flp pilus assembly protein TadD